MPPRLQEKFEDAAVLLDGPPQPVTLVLDLQLHLIQMPFVTGACPAAAKLEELLAEHARAMDGARRRIVDPAHFAPLFGGKPRGQVMLYPRGTAGPGWRGSAVPERA